MRLQATQAGRQGSAAHLHPSPQAVQHSPFSSKLSSFTSMEHEGVFNSGRAAGDLVGSGSTSMERDRTRSLLMGQLGSGGGLVDGGSSSMERSHNQPMVGLGLGSAMAQDARTGFGASRPQAGQVMEVHPTVMGLASMKLEGEAVPQRSKKHKGCNEGQLKEPGSIRDFYLKQD